MMNNLQDLLLDLFHAMRSSAGMKLTMEQFDVFCQAVAVSEEIKTWAQLRRLCRLVWVKPHDSYDSARFEKAFDAYQENCQDAAQAFFAQVGDDSESKPKVVPLGQIPEIPPRSFLKPASEKFPTPSPKSNLPQQTAQAVKLPTQKQTQFVLQQLPLTLDDLKQTGRALRRPLVSHQDLEVDVDATLEKIGREGILNDVVQRPILGRQADLLLLMDDDNPMIPFRPALQPLIQAALDQPLGMVQMYRFTTYPVQYLYPWERPTQAVAVSTVLARLHPQRTIAMIVSDAGAASRTYNPRRAERTGEFLAQLVPCVRDIVWLNPVPSERWENTTAGLIETALAGRMVPLENVRVQQVARGQRSEVGVQLWSLMNCPVNKRKLNRNELNSVWNALSNAMANQHYSLHGMHPFR